MKQKLILRNEWRYRYLFLLFVSSTLYLFLDDSFFALHITNFAYTGIVASLTIYKFLKKGLLTYGLLFGSLLFWSLANIVIEFFEIREIRLFGLTILDHNTPDPFDALFGLVAVFLIGFVVLQYCSTEVKNEE